MVPSVAFILRGKCFNMRGKLNVFLFYTATSELLNCVRLFVLISFYLCPMNVTGRTFKLPFIFYQTFHRHLDRDSRLEAAYPPGQLGLYSTGEVAKVPFL